MSEFSCTSRREGDLAVVDVAGEIDHAVAERLWDETAQWLTPGARVLLDCSRVDFCDSVGVGVLLRVYKSAMALEAVFALAAPSAKMTRILDLAGLTALFRIVQTPAALHDVEDGLPAAPPAS